jgi:hypothetical protein
MRMYLTGMVMIATTTAALGGPPNTSSSAPSGASYVPPPEAEPLGRGPDYRWQMVVSDLASVGLAASGGGAGIGLGLVGYTLGGPIIHDLNDGGGRAGTSFGVRLGAPVLGALAFAGLAKLGDHCRKDDFDCDDSPGIAIVAGAVLGAAVAIVVDDLFLARPRKIYARPTVGLSAIVDHDRAGIALAGRF